MTNDDFYGCANCHGEPLEKQNAHAVQTKQRTTKSGGRGRTKRGQAKRLGAQVASEVWPPAEAGVMKPLTYNKGELIQEDGSAWEENILGKGEGFDGAYLTSCIQIDINGTELYLPTKIYFDHQPYEPWTHTDPGCPEEVTVNCVEVVGLKTGALEEWLADNCHDLDTLVFEAIIRQREKDRDDEAGRERYED